MTMTPLASRNASLDRSRSDRERTLALAPIFRLHHLQGVAPETIAAALALPTRTVKRELHLATAWLYPQLG